MTTLEKIKTNFIENVDYIIATYKNTDKTYLIPFNKEISKEIENIENPRNINFEYMILYNKSYFLEKNYIYDLYIIIFSPNNSIYIEMINPMFYSFLESKIVNFAFNEKNNIYWLEKEYLDKLILEYADNKYYLKIKDEKHIEILKYSIYNNNKIKREEFSIYPIQASIIFQKYNNPYVKNCNIYDIINQTKSFKQITETEFLKIKQNVDKENNYMKENFKNKISELKKQNKEYCKNININELL